MSTLQEDAAEFRRAARQLFDEIARSLRLPGAVEWLDRTIPARWAEPLAYLGGFLWRWWLASALALSAAMALMVLFMWIIR